MAFTEKILVPTRVISTPNTETTVYTCPTNQTTTTIIKQIIICNTSSASVCTFDLSLVPSGGSAGTSNRVFANVLIPIHETVIFDLSQVLTSGDFLSARFSNSVTTITVSGIESAGAMVISGLADSAVTTAKIANSNVTAAKLGPDAFLANNQAGAIILMEMM
jgi:hypothetical protein